MRNAVGVAFFSFSVGRRPRGELVSVEYEVEAGDRRRRRGVQLRVTPARSMVVVVGVSMMAISVDAVDEKEFGNSLMKMVE